MINNKQQGFTLIELMMTVAILGILSAIAIPSYMSYVTKSKRTEAKTELLRVAQLQESHYVQNLSYAKTLTGLGFAAATLNTETGLYSIASSATPVACDGTNANPCTGYSIVATPVTGKGQDKDDDCANGFMLTNTGFKGAKSSTDAAFTSAATIQKCWG